MFVSYCQWFKKTRPWALCGAGSKIQAQDLADRHWFTTSSRWVFCRAAATSSLSANCLFIACSEAWVPGVMCTSVLKRWGRDRRSLPLVDRPIRVAILQWEWWVWRPRPPCSRGRSPEPGLALLRSILLASGDAPGHWWSESNRRSRARRCCRNLLVLLARGHGPVPERS